MSKQRLSKLQKWILTTCYQEVDGQVIKAMKVSDIMRFFKNTYWIESQEFVIPKNFKAFMRPDEYNKASATISRTIKNMHAKGYMNLIGKKTVTDFSDAVDLVQKYKTKEDLEKALRSMSLEEVQKMANGFKEEKTKTIIDVLNKNDKSKVIAIELTDLGIEKRKEILKLSS